MGKIRVLLTLILLLFPVLVRAEALEITADEALEWQREEQRYIARGHAMAKRGNLELHGDVLTAFYQKTAQSDTDITRITAKGNVRLVTPDGTAFGDYLVYNIKTRVAFLTGRQLRLQTKNETITARDSLEYWDLKNLAIARGQAVVVQKEKNYRLQADVLSALFKKNAQNKMVLQQVDAEGHVLIDTGTEQVRGDEGIYNANHAIAILNGNVTIIRDQSTLQGDTAEIDFKKGTSRLFAKPGPKKSRVRALLVPEE